MCVAMPHMIEATADDLVFDLTTSNFASGVPVFSAAILARGDLSSVSSQYSRYMARHWKGTCAGYYDFVVLGCTMARIYIVY